MPYFYFDSYYFILIIPAMILGMLAQARVTSAFNKYKNVRSSRGYTGADVARRILDSNGLNHVRVERVSGRLSDHFDPRSNTIRLSDEVYLSSSIASIGVAAHEVGHAIQHDRGYLPIKVRNLFVPVANLGSTLGIPLIILGVLIDISGLTTIGLITFSAVAVFQTITLPVEFNASSRAIKTLENDGYLEGEELNGAKKVLSAAALTYVAALIMSLAQLLRLFLLYGNRSRD